MKTIRFSLSMFLILTHAALFSQNADRFGFFGYMRSGFGLDGQGGPHEAFRAPNAEAKYRLGNETEAYIEALFRYTIEDENEVVYETNLRLAFVTPTSKSNDFSTTTSVREAYVRMMGLMKKKPELVLWAGERFYDRYDAHMNDFWYRDMSGFGGGFEHLVLWKDVKLSTAFLGGTIDQLNSNGTIFPEDDFVLNKTTLDISLYDFRLGNSSLGFTMDWSYFSGDTVETNLGDFIINSSHGWSLGLFHELPLKGGWNRLNVFYGNGAAENYRAIIQSPLGLDPLPGVPIEVEDISRFRVIDHLQVDLSEKFSLLGEVVYQHLDNGQSATNLLNWYSIGLRPSYHLSRYLSLVFEFGFDYTTQSGADQGYLLKMTFAPQISPMNKILSRPAIRMYFTYARWSDAYVGQVAPISFGDQNHGLSFGIQMESWW